MSATSRRSGGASPVDPEASLFFIVLGVVVTVALTVTAAVHIGLALDGSAQHVPANPVTLTLNLISGDVAWPHSATLALAAIVVLLAVLGTAGGVLYSRRRGRRSRVDRAARRMARGRDLEPIGRKQAAATAKRLGVDSPGLTVARTVAGGRPLYQGGRTSRSTCGDRVSARRPAAQSRPSSRRPAPSW